ncbi:MAG: NosD domain-containing protein [Candidatus Thermoplasmatota archaeon]
MKKSTVVLVISFFLLNFFTGLNFVKNVSADTGASTLYVGGNNPSNYTTIQDAVEAANKGDTVYVYNGTYYENIKIIKSINLVGEDKNNTIIDGKRAHSVIYITADGVSITGFTIQNGSRDNYLRAGIEIYSVDNKIKGNIITDNLVGIHPLFAGAINKGGNNTFIGNIVTKNDMDAFCIHSSYNIIRHNHIKNNAGGIFLQINAVGNIIEQNNFVNNGHQAGFYKARLTHWDNNYWDNWIGLENFFLKWCPKMIPKCIPFMNEFRRIPWPSFDFHPASKPFNI